MKTAQNWHGGAGKGRQKRDKTKAKKRDMHDQKEAACLFFVMGYPIKRAGNMPYQSWIINLWLLIIRNFQFTDSPHAGIMFYDK